MSCFEWTLPDADGPVGFAAEGSMFHATRAKNVASILAHGLLAGAPADGVLGMPAGQDSNDEFYGMRPVYLLLEPAVSTTYTWEQWNQDEPEEPVLLEVDARGLTLLPDLETLFIPHYVWVRPEGIGWWGRRDATWKLAVDPARVPPEFGPFADATGVVPYPVLMTAAARTAVEFTKTAAVVEDISPSRIRLHEGTVRRYETA